MASGRRSVTRRRGATTPRSSSRTKPAKPARAAKPRAKAAAKAAKPRTKAAAKAAPPRAKVAPPRAKAAPPRAKARRPAPPPRAAPQLPLVETLGTIRCPSGKLAIFDIGLVGFLPREALEPAIVTADVPRTQELVVTGARVGRGRFADCWEHVAVNLAAGDVHAARKLGAAGVDFARLVCMDHAALDHWQHEDSLDGLADVVFWGRDEAQLARAMHASRSKEGYGWSDLPVADAEAKVMEAERLKAERRWLLKIDYRPHTHHYQALAEARASANGAGAIELAGTRLLLVFTSWGDGVFPVYLDLDADDRPVRVRIQLATAEASAAMAAVNP